MKTIYHTDGSLNTIINGVGLTIGYHTLDEENTVSFTNITDGYKRNENADLNAISGALSGGGIIGYFNEAALKKPRKGLEVPLLIEMIASGKRNDVVIPPLCMNTAESLTGASSPEPLILEEQHALFVRVLGPKWEAQVAAFKKK